MKRSIPVAAPALIGNEKKYVLDCLDTSWISSCGKYIDLFEEQFARFCNTGHAIACSNGTVALHLALKALDVGPGDEVIVPTLTFVATANAVTYCGATPVFADSEPLTWNMDPSLIESSHHTAHERDYRSPSLRTPGGHGPNLGGCTRPFPLRDRRCCRGTWG